uniref:Uncharacterized protein n=1 Tax=Romanomermis culicivorax TaxID=13658 RepID=A0A915KAZ8_ROMCU
MTNYWSNCCKNITALRLMEQIAKSSRVAMLVHEVTTSSNAPAAPHDKTSEKFRPYMNKMVAKSNLDTTQE